MRTDLQGDCREGSLQQRASDLGCWMASGLVIEPGEVVTELSEAVLAGAYNVHEQRERAVEGSSLIRSDHRPLLGPGLLPTLGLRHLRFHCRWGPRCCATHDHRPSIAAEPGLVGAGH